jgi:hypothetical protein
MAKKTYTNLPMTMTAFRKQVAVLNAALKKRFGADVFHHAEYANREWATPRADRDESADKHNILTEMLDREYHKQCDLFDKSKLSELGVYGDNMHGAVVLDVWVYETLGYGDEYDLLDQVNAYFKNGEFIGLSSYEPEDPEYQRLLAEVQK